MEPLDTPIKLDFKNGIIAPRNTIFIGYMFILCAIPLFLYENMYVAIGTILVGSMLSFTTHGVTIFPEDKKVESYVKLFGFIRFAKTKIFQPNYYITAIPSKLTQTMYYGKGAHSSSSQTHYVHTICLLNQRFKGKIELTTFDSKNESEEVSKRLAKRLNLEFFSYDPKKIRALLLNSRN